MPTLTTNLSLEKPLGSEQVDIAVINGNMDTIDGVVSSSGVGAAGAALAHLRDVSVAASYTGSTAKNMLDLQPTWNTSGVMRGIYVAVTHTAAAATSRAIEVRRDANTIFGVDLTTNTAVNGIEVVGSATGVKARLAAVGSDVDVGIVLVPKGAGAVEVLTGGLTVTAGGLTVAAGGITVTAGQTILPIGLGGLALSSGGGASFGLSLAGAGAYTNGGVIKYGRGASEKNGWIGSINNAETFFGTDGAYTFYTGTNDAAIGTERVRIGSDGRVGIGQGTLGTRVSQYFTTSADSGVSSAGASQDAYGALFIPELNKTASTGNLFGVNMGLGGTVSGGVTATTAITLRVAGPTISNSGTISEASSLYVVNPVLGGTVTNQYAIKHNDTTANLSTAGAWNPASHEFREDGTPFKLRRGLLADRLDVMAAVRRLVPRVYAYAAEPDGREFAGVFAEETAAVSGLLSDDRNPHMIGLDALALAAIQALDARVTALEAL